MAGQATKIVQVYEVPNWHLVSVPEQLETRVRDAFETAARLHLVVADFASTAMNTNELQKAKDNYSISVDPKTLPKEVGWHRIDRDLENNTITFRPISEKEAEGLILDGRTYDLLYVSDSVVEPTIQGLPVALSVGYYINSPLRCLYVDGWPQSIARVAQLAPQSTPISHTHSLLSKPILGKPILNSNLGFSEDLISDKIIKASGEILRC